jgi:hypothetical protein
VGWLQGQRKVKQYNKSQSKSTREEKEENEEEGKSRSKKTRRGRQGRRVEGGTTNVGEGGTRNRDLIGVNRRGYRRWAYSKISSALDVHNHGDDRFRLTA